MNKVRDLAVLKHSGQLYGDKDYMYHIDGVVALIKKHLGKHLCVDKLIDMGYLHDILEDTDASDEEILSVTNIVVLNNVKILTDKEGSNRKERHLNTYYLIKENELCVLVKICDRLFHLENFLKSKNPDMGKAKMYLKEGFSFKMGLFDPRHPYAKKMWKIYDETLKSVNDKIYPKRKK